MISRQFRDRPLLFVHPVQLFPPDFCLFSQCSWRISPMRRKRNCANRTDIASKEPRFFRQIRTMSRGSRCKFFCIFANYSAFPQKFLHPASLASPMYKKLRNADMRCTPQKYEIGGLLELILWFCIANAIPFGFLIFAVLFRDAPHLCWMRCKRNFAYGWFLFRAARSRASGTRKNDSAIISGSVSAVQLYDQPAERELRWLYHRGIA